jgi:hypothetical protein
MFGKVRFLLSLLLLPWAAFAMERAELLSPKEEIKLQITNFSMFRKQLEKAHQTLLDDARYADFEVAFAQKIKKNVRSSSITFELQQICRAYRFFEGEFIFCDAAEYGSGFELAAALTAETYAKSIQQDEWLSALSDASVEVVKSTFQGVEIRQNIFSQTNGTTQSEWQAFVNGTLFASNHREWIERSIIRLKNESISEPVGNQLNVQLNLAEMIHSLRDKKDRQQFEMILHVLGANAYRFSLVPSADAWVFNGYLSVPEPKKSLFSLFCAENVHPSTVGLPPDTGSFLAGTLNLPLFWKTLPSLLEAVSPQLARQFHDLPILFKNNFEVDLENEILANIGSKYQMLWASDEAKSWLLKLDTTNPKALDQAFVNLLSAPIFSKKSGSVLSSEQFRNHTIHLFGRKDKENALAFCIANRDFLFGSNSLLKSVLLQSESSVFLPQPRVVSLAQKEILPNAYALGGSIDLSLNSYLDLRLSDHSFDIGAGFKSKKSEEESLGENEISFNYLQSFLKTILHSAELTPEGVHHVVIFKNK